jgi:nucleoside-diphosphate-sugar epimerase
MNRPKQHALIAGATGIVGTRLAQHLHASGWDVVGLCRRPPASPLPYRMLAVDLTDARDCRDKRAALNTVTHVFYAARYDHPEGTTESVDVNAAMLVNLVEAIEPIADGLRHVNLVHGTKYYGHMLGPLQVPIAEDAPRARAPNFYFAQEDFIRDRQLGKRWTYSTVRPHTFCDGDATEPRNAALLIAVHATLARALGEPLVYPGSEQSFNARTQFTFVPMLARAIEWMATEEHCGNEAFNIVNGDSPRWADLWPRFADYFEVRRGQPARMRLADDIARKEAVWQTLVERHDLVPTKLAARVLWPYADYLFAPEWDIISSVSKARRHGFSEGLDSARMFEEVFETFRRDKIIP